MGRVDGEAVKRNNRNYYRYLNVRYIFSIVIVGIIIVTALADIAISSFKDKCVDFYELDRDMLAAGNSVYLYVDAILENYGYIEHTTDSMKTSVDEYYIVWLDDGAVVSISVNDKQTEDILNELCEYTWDYLNASEATWEPPHFLKIEGRLEKMDSKMTEFYNESLEYMGFNEESKIIYYNINATSAVRKHIVKLAMFVPVEILLIVLLAIRIKKHKKQEIEAAKREEEARKAAQMAGFEDHNSYEPLNYEPTDYETAKYDDPFKNEESK